MLYPGNHAPLTNESSSNPPLGLLQAVRNRCRLKHYSLKTEKAYVYWIRRYIFENNKVHPRELNGVVERFLTTLATRDKVSASTQNQALSAILFLYKEVLGISLPWMENVVRAKHSKRLPVVLGKHQVLYLLSYLSGREWLLGVYH
jgi:site-specific recombinase XerD